jgi:hypothetical protein
VFATDTILAHLMASPRTALPWDIVATYLPGGVIFLDVRDPVAFEMATVNENSNHAAEPKEPGDINGTAEVALEASVINQSISQVVRACGTGDREAAERQTSARAARARAAGSPVHSIPPPSPWGGHEDTIGREQHRPYATAP